jgi:hypothetical protein
MTHQIRVKKRIALGMLLGLFATVGFSKPAAARVPYVDTILGRDIAAMLALAGRSGLEVTAPFRELTPTAREKSRLENAYFRVSLASGFSLRYLRTHHLILIAGVPDEPNAFAVGEAIYLSRALLDLLDDQQLTAVVAHEVGHAERGHLLERMGNMYAGVLVHFWDSLVADWRYLSRGQIDETMAELISKGHWATLLQTLGQAELGQEIQADCIAWQWLESLNRLGYRNRPDDLLSSIETLVGLSADSLLREGSLAPRISRLKYRTHTGGRCY